ncbi:MAG: hypothetical protein HY453_00055 [Parcubacteria group bacterium]|nr:hypothetical protein [Parcubacteria group bacterium]
MTTPMIVAFAGTFGVGKSTAAIALKKKYSDDFAIIHMDDYQREEESVPTWEGMPNWEHPDAFDVEKLKSDLHDLKQGKSVMIAAKNEHDNSEYLMSKKRKNITVEPGRIVVIEGDFALCFPEVNKMFDVKIFFDALHELKVARHRKFVDYSYVENILIPMHKKFVLPSSQYANYRLDITYMGEDMVVQKIEDILKILS